MYEWIFTVQKLIDWIDGHAIENPSLSEISKQVGYYRGTVPNSFTVLSE